jgi:hypothetical protein
MAAIAGSGGTADQYGGKYLDERKRVPIMSARDPAEAVALVLEKVPKDMPAKASLE